MNLRPVWIPDTTSWIREFLDSYRRDSGATILFASHDMREVELLCDEVILLRRGKIGGARNPAITFGQVRPQET